MNAICTGEVRHRRFSPKENNFSYKVGYYFINLEEVPQIFKYPFLFAHNRPAIISFWDKDYISAEVIKKNIEDHFQDSTVKQISILTNPSYFGFCFNPVSFYYCYNDKNELRYIISHITNTPWGEKHLNYISFQENPTGVIRFQKEFHVSPFMPMEMGYTWSFRQNEKDVVIHMENRPLGKDKIVFDATFKAKLSPLAFSSVLKNFIFFPALTFKIAAAIYWQAFILYFIKRIPFYTHPDKRKPHEL